MNPLSRTERLAQIGTLVASVAHEINNPAAFVLTNQGLMIELLEELEVELRKDEVDVTRAIGHVREIVDMCQDNRAGIKRIAGIVRELRNHARSETETETVAVNDAVTTAVNMVRNRVRHEAELAVDLDTVPGAVGDTNKIAQVVMNLIVNASHAIRVADVERGLIEVSTVTRASHVGIVVRDNGSGMTDEVRGRIFEPFFTTKDRDEGTGLGLAISADIVRKFGGRIDCESTPGKGTTFEVLLPCATLPPAAMPSEGSDLRPPPSSRPSRILVVDDDMQVARSLQRALDPPHRVVIAHGGSAAIEMLKRDQRFDVVICDIMMPGADGPTVYDTACEIEPSLGPRFIFATGGAFSPSTREFLRSTPNTVCSKPIALDELRMRIDERLVALRSCSAA